MREGEPKNESGGQGYLKHTGQESLPVEITSKKKIGEGGFGNVYSVETQITKKNKVKEKTLAVKTFHYGGDAQKALDRFRALKEKGLKTFTTYRLSEDKKSILMTYGNKTDYFLVSHNNDSESQEWLIDNPIKEIANFEQLVIGMIKQAKLAAEERIGLNDDVYFFAVSGTDKPDVKNIDFILGDLDNVCLDLNKKRALERNINSVKSTLDDFVKKFVQGANKYEYLNLLYEKFKDSDPS